jgi:hypothetical protein
MKKATLLLVMATAMLFSNSYAQVTTKGGSSTTTTDKNEKVEKGDKKEKVQDEMSKDAATTAKDWTTKMDEICNLDPTQEKKIMEINLKYANKLEELKTKYKGMENPNADAAKAEKDELTKQRFKDYSNVLSKEQMQKFKEYRTSKKGEDAAEGDKSEKKEDVKEKYKNATPEEKEKMKEEMKEKKEKKSTKE